MSITFFLSNWKYIAMAGLMASLVFLGAYVKIMKSEIAKCNAEKESLSVALDASQSSVKQLQIAIDEQNRAIENIKELADEKEKKYLLEIAKAKSNSAKNKKKVDELLNRVKPKNLTSCEASDKLINEEIADVR